VLTADKNERMWRQRNTKLQLILNQYVEGFPDTGIDKVKRACLHALPREARHEAFYCSKPEEFLDLLANDFVGIASDSCSIAKFANNLVQIPEFAQNFGESLNTWAEAYGISNTERPDDEEIRPCLSIVIKESFEGYSVSAWLAVNNQEGYPLNFNYFQEEDIKEFLYQSEILDAYDKLAEKINKRRKNVQQSQDVQFSLDELKRLVNLFVNEAWIIITQVELPSDDLGYSYRNLLVEFFLPLALLLTEVESWKYTDPTDKKIQIGHSFAVVVRSQERLEWKLKLNNASRQNLPPKLRTRYSLLMGDWKTAWNFTQQKMEAPLQENDFLFSASFDKLDEEFFEDLREKLRSVVGIGFVCPEKQVEALQIVEFVVKVTFAEELSTLIKDKELCNWRKHIRQKRFADRNDLSKTGNYITLMWDDPDRLPPFG
jgi:hypothetical protein